VQKPAGPVEGFIDVDLGLLGQQHIEQSRLVGAKAIVVALRLANSGKQLQP
jgi:hypothetical protein